VSVDVAYLWAEGVSCHGQTVNNGEPRHIKKLAEWEGEGEAVDYTQIQEPKLTVIPKAVFSRSARRVHTQQRV
jgi:hypothetical protein